MNEIELIEKTALRVGMKSLMNHGAASCVYTEGCNGVSQDHLIAFAREVALHCVAAGHSSQQEPLSEAQIMKCIADAGCYGTIKMSFESGPYSINRPSLNADKLVRAVERAHGIAAPANGEVKS